MPSPFFGIPTRDEIVAALDSEGITMTWREENEFESSLVRLLSQICEKAGARVIERSEGYIMYEK